MKGPNYEQDSTTFPAEAYTVKGYKGIEWSGYEERTGLVVCVMVGDDKRFCFEPSELTPLDDLAYCASCGQVGCGHDGRDRA